MIFERSEEQMLQDKWFHLAAARRNSFTFIHQQQLNEDIHSVSMLNANVKWIFSAFTEVDLRIAGAVWIRLKWNNILEVVL